MKTSKLFIIIAALFLASQSQALIVNGKGFQQRGFRIEQVGNIVELIPRGSLPEVVVVGRRQILSITLEQRLRAQTDRSFLSNGSLHAVPARWVGAAELFVISQENGRNAQLVMAPVNQPVLLPKDFLLRSESLGFFEVKNGNIQPFKDVGEGSYMYTFPIGDDGFNSISKQFSIQGHVPQNLGAAKVEFRLRLTANMTKAGWVALRSKDEIEVLRFYVPEAARSGQVISVVREMPNLTADMNQLDVVSNGIPMTDFKFRILEIQTTRNYSAR